MPYFNTSFEKIIIPKTDLQIEGKFRLFKEYCIAVEASDDDARHLLV